MRSFFIALLSLAALSHADVNYDCDDGPFVPGTTGGEGMMPADHPTVACMAKWRDGKVITGFRGWTNQDNIVGVQFKYSDGSQSDIIGHDLPDTWFQQVYDKDDKGPGGGYKWAEWGANDAVRVEIWNKKSKGIVGGMNGPARIKIWRDLGQGQGNKIYEMGINEKNVEGNPLSDIDNGIGIIFAVKARQYGHVTSIEFRFQKAHPIGSRLVTMKIHEDLNTWNAKEDGKQKGVENAIVSDLWWRNLNPIGGKPQQFGQTVKRERTISKEITSQTGSTWSHAGDVKVHLEVGIPFLASSKQEIGYKLEYTTQEMKSNTNKTEDTVSFEIMQGSGFNAGLLEPQRAANCQLTLISGTFTGTFDGEVEVEFPDGLRFRYRTSGTAESINWLEGSSSCKDMPLDKAKEGVEWQPFEGGGQQKRALEFRG